MVRLRVLIWPVLLFTFIYATSALGGDIREIILEGRVGALLPNGARWSLSVVDMASGKEIINTGNSVSEGLVPASLMKLLTASAALDLSKQGRLDMTTSLLHDGAVEGGVLKGNLYIVGRGNAMLSSVDLEKAVQEIARKGIRKIEGDIIADASLFDGGVSRNRKGPAYSMPSALGLNLHTAAVVVVPGEAGKEPVVSMEPQNDAVKFTVSARSVDVRKSSLKVRKLNDRYYGLEGNIPTNSAGYRRRFALDDPALYAAGVLRTLLKSEGVEVMGEVKKGKTPEEAKLLAKMEAPSLDKVIREMNVNSLNIVADNLLLRVGAKRYGAPGTAEKGIKAVEEMLAGFEDSRGSVDRVQGPRGRGFKVADGSGLSVENRISAGLMARYLQGVSKKQWYSTFRESLPRPGREGTVRMIGFDNDRFRVKLGRLEKAFGLAGYGADEGGREFAFAYMVNGSRGDIIGAEKSGAHVLKLLAGE